MTAGLRAILIAGPTASGKSALALAVAERLGSAVVNADSMQVYRELAILSARPPAADEARVPHRLYGFVPAAEPYSAGRWRRDLAGLLAAWPAEAPPLVVTGGTGLYFEALTRGLSAMPDVPPAARREAQALLDRDGAAALAAAVADVDPAVAASRPPGDTQRLLRAYEVFLATGRRLSDLQAAPPEPLLGPDAWAGWVLDLPRPLLYERCDARLVAMLEAGALDEVARLAALGLDAGLPAMKALGVRPLLGHVAGGVPLAAALAEAQQGTRNYAKRQLTWFRHRMAGWPRLDAQFSECAEREIVSFVLSRR